MGGCVGRERGGPQRSSRNGGRTRKRGGRNEPLKTDRPKWKSDYPMTEGQLRSKRDEFWDTAPAFDGRKEIWDALKAAAVAAEGNDLELAQAIVDGASITLPQGSLADCYDELGNRYQLPAYCLAPPANLVTERSEDEGPGDRPETPAPTGAGAPPKKEFPPCGMSDSVAQLKKQLHAQEGIDYARQRWFFSGKLLPDKTRLQDTKIQKDFVIQVIVSPPPLT
ncbi:hypothetical protein COCON_G00226580 [Conger conger]|uniref:Ubiquitin-like domain-containing protein n=1 Tax=Conger conger TaxID=82655 RepID=A0A9Q1CX31_CONCO|nr:hypothetical protein COCON_G00226580 [Conger conger]